MKSGFIPAWVEMTVKPESVVEELNRENLQGVSETE